MNTGLEHVRQLLEKTDAHVVATTRRLEVAHNLQYFAEQGKEDRLTIVALDLEDEGSIQVQLVTTFLGYGFPNGMFWYVLACFTGVHGSNPPVNVVNLSLRYTTVPLTTSHTLSTACHRLMPACAHQVLASGLPSYGPLICKLSRAVTD